MVSTIVSTVLAVLALGQGLMAEPTPVVDHPAVEFTDGAAVKLCQDVHITYGPAHIGGDWAQCAYLLDQLSEIHGEFTIIGLPAYNGHVPVLSTTGEECTFSADINTVKGTEGARIPIGDKDVRAILATSVKQYSLGSLLSVRGNMVCGGTLVEFQIARS